MDEKRFISRDLRTSSSGEVLRESSALNAVRDRFVCSRQRYDDRVEAAICVGDLVRQELTFRSSSATTPYLTPEAIAETKTANCYGHTIVASECLEGVGIEHMISYANQHAFITLFDRESRNAFMIDVAVKDFYIDISDVIGGEDPLDQIQEGKLRAENTFYSLEFLKKLGAKHSMIEEVREREWLSFVHPDKKSDWNDESRLKLQLLSYPSIPGREMLTRYYNGLLATSKGDYMTAYDDLQDLQGVYPDIDERNRFKQIHGTVQGLMAAKQYEEAQEIADMASGSIDSRYATDNTLYRLKIKRAIATQTLSLVKLDEAIGEYRTMSGRRVHDRLKKAQQERVRLVKNQLEEQQDSIIEQEKE